MRFLNIKLRRDIFRNWTQFFSVFFMAFLSVLVFTGLQGAWHGLEVSLDKYIEESNLPDAWVQSIGFTEEDIDEIGQISGVEQVRQKTRIKVSTQADAESEKYLWLDTFDQSMIDTTLVDGEAVSGDAADGVWLNQEYAKENGIKVGDPITISYADTEATLKVAGLIQSAERIYYTGTLEFIAPNYADYGYGLISEDTLRETIGYPGPDNILEIRGSNDSIREELEGILGANMISYYDRHTLVDVSDALDRVGQIRNLSYLFSFIFILLAILAMYTTIRRLIETQTKEIAVLKALGFSNGKIAVHYGSFGMLIGGLGSLLGILAAPVLSQFVLWTQKSMFSLPKWQIAYSFSSLLVILLVLTICVASALLAAREAVAGLPAVFLRGTEKRGHPIFLEHSTKLWDRLRFESRWAIRDAAINKVRLFMGIIGVAGSMMLLIAGFGMPESMNHLVDKAYNEDYSYKSRLEVGDYKTYSGDYAGQWVQITQARYQPDDGYNRLLIVLGEGDYVNLKTEEGRQIQKGGIYVTKGFAERAGLRVGDTLAVHPSLDEKQYTFKIEGIITSETNQGAYITQETWEQAGGTFTPQTLLTGEEVSFSEAADSSDIHAVIEISEQEKNAYGFVNSLMSVFFIIIAFAVLLVVVVLYNLGSLNFVERMRDYATLRVLGFHKKELRNITMIENVATTFIGWLLGIPMGIWFLGQYVRTFSTIRLEYTSYISIRTLIFASAIAWICSLSTTIFVSRRIQKLDMVEALKGVE